MSSEARKKRLVGFIDHGDEFWDHLEQGVLKLPYCAGCGREMWEANFHRGPTVRCSECGSWDLVWNAQQARGRIFAWAKSHKAYPGAEARVNDVPYTTLEVEIGGAGGPRVLGVLKGTDSGLKVGARVEGTIEAASEKTFGYPCLRWSLLEAESEARTD